MSALRVLARMLGCHADDADDAMRSERGYRAALSRRSFPAAGAALATGKVFVPSVELERPNLWHQPYTDAIMRAMTLSLGFYGMASRYRLADADSLSPALLRELKNIP